MTQAEPIISISGVKDNARFGIICLCFRNSSVNIINKDIPGEPGGRAESEFSVGYVKFTVLKDMRLRVGRTEESTCALHEFCGLGHLIYLAS